MSKIKEELSIKQKTCCSSECKNNFFKQTIKKENSKWTDEYKKTYEKEYRIKNKQKISNQMKIWRLNNKEHLKKTKKNARVELKRLIIDKYSNGTGCCVKCGFNDSRALQIDHINNDGAEERKKLFGSRLDAGIRFYYYLKRNNFPDGYQVLCANCNIIKLREHLQNGS